MIHRHHLDAMIVLTGFGDWRLRREGDPFVRSILIAVRAGGPELSLDRARLR